MRHNIKKDKINLKYSHKKLLIINLSNSLIKFEFLKTTFSKVKLLKQYLEPIIHISKYFCNNNIRFVFNKLRNVESVLKLFKIIGPRYINRSGGYLRILKVGYRKGDNAKLGLIKTI